jgi:predicted transcriptional regulator YheO
VVDSYCRAVTPEDAVPELFMPDVESMLGMHINEVVEQYAVPVTLMKKEDKLVVVRQLDERGVFLVRGAVNTVARALGVSRYTIYNYLEEIKGQQGGKDREVRGDES